jgi:hypothetical protein
MLGNRAWEWWNIVLEHCFTIAFSTLTRSGGLVDGIISGDSKQTAVQRPH